MHVKLHFSEASYVIEGLNWHELWDWAEGELSGIASVTITRVTITSWGYYYRSVGLLYCFTNAKNSIATTCVCAVQNYNINKYLLLSWKKHMLTVLRSLLFRISDE